MAKRKEPSFIDMLTPEQQAAVDKLGYEFLAEYGYNVDGAERSAKKRRKLKAALRANSQALAHSMIERKEERAIVLFFSLLDADGEVIARSKGIKFIFKGVDGDDGRAGQG